MTSPAATPSGSSGAGSPSTVARGDGEGGGVGNAASGSSSPVITAYAPATSATSVTVMPPVAASWSRSTVSPWALRTVRCPAGTRIVSIPPASTAAATCSASPDTGRIAPNGVTAPDRATPDWTSVP